MEDRYFVEAPDGARFGPADLATLRGWVAESRLHPSSILISERTGESLRADALEGLFGGAGVEPPVIAAGPPPTAMPVPTMPYAAPKTRSPFLIVAAVLAGVCVCTVPILGAILFPVFAQAKTAAQRTKALSNMKMLATGVLIYAGDSDDCFPPKMESARAMEPWIDAYVKNSAIFVSSNPKGGEILGDKRLSGRSQTALAQPARTTMLYDSLPWQRGDYLLAHTDGSVKFQRTTSVSSLLAPNPFGAATE